MESISRVLLQRGLWRRGRGKIMEKGKAWEGEGEGEARGKGGG
jgi:hypothetical protein